MKLFLFEGLRKLPTIIALLVLVSCLGGLPSWISYMIYIAYIILIYVSIKKINCISNMLLLFLVSIALSTLIAAPNPVFHSWERLIAFTALVLSTTSIFQSSYNRSNRKAVLESILVLSTIISLISFVCYFLNINLFVDKFYGGYLSDYNDYAGHFSGITRHSMILGPIAGISVIYELNKVMTDNKKISWFILLICIGTLFFSASRGAILATMAGVFIIFYKYFKDAKYRKYIIFLFIMGAITIPYYMPYVLSSFNKHEGIDSGAYGTRTVKVEARLSEIKDNFISGVGFSAIDPNGIDSYNNETGSIEPGSSWLAVFSMNGIICFVFFLSIYCKCLKIAKSSTDALLFSLIAFFGVHMLVEGYVFSAGNAIAFILWLVIGACLDIQYQTNTDPIILNNNNIQ